MRAALLRLTLAAAHHEHADIDPADLATLCLAVQMGQIEALTPLERWAWLAEALLAPHPSHFLIVLRQCGGLRRLLPEIDALFGVPQLGDTQEFVDVGLHQLRLIDQTAGIDAPLAVRFAALMHKIGMGGTPREIWPSHYKHEQRAHELLDAMTTRFALPADALALARLVVDECERVHRASDMRAGAITAMLQRLQAAEQPDRFDQLLTVCSCDYAAYPGHTIAGYPKAPRLRRALAAYVRADVSGLGDDDAQQRRAEAIAETLRSHARLV